MEHKTDGDGSREMLYKANMPASYEEIRMLNQELLAEREQEMLLQFPWTGNLGHWYWNVGTDTVTNNTLRLEALGYKREDLPDRLTYAMFSDWIHPDDYQRVQAAIHAHLEGRTAVFEQQYRLRTKDGKYLWYYDRARVTQYDEKGQPAFMAGIVFDITEKMRQEQVLRDREELDKLTHLYTCGKMLAVIDAELSRSSATQKSGLIVMDIDHFFTVNAVIGQLRGDTILQELADILRQFESSRAIIGRTGGDEFVLFIPRTTAEACRKVAEELQQRFNQIYLDEGRQYRLSVSMGMSVSNEKDSQILLDNAMVALCRSKKVKSGEIAQYEKLQSYVGFLRTYPVSKIDHDVTWEEDIVTFAHRTIEQVNGIKNALHVLFSRVARQYSVQSICVTSVGDQGWTEEVLFLWDEKNGFAPDTEQVRLSEAEYQRRAKWLSGNEATVMAPVGFGGVNGGVLTGRLDGKLFPQLYCPVYVQGVYQGNVIFAARKLVYSWDRRTMHRLKTISNTLYSAICKETAENSDRAKTEFLSRMGRELRTPLNTIVSMLELVKNNSQDTARVAYCIDKIEDSAQYLLSLVYDVMEISRKGIGHFGIAQEQFAMKITIDLIERLIHGVTESGPHFSCTKKIIHNNLIGDGESLHQILLSLLANAVKFTSKEGRIGLDVCESEKLDSGEIIFLFSVWDTGIGIPSKGINYFNDVFSKRTNDYSGLGSGLLACMRLLDSMGSHLNVESAEGKGCRFFFQLKLMEHEGADDKRPGTELFGRRILAVDDNEMNIETVRDLLESRGAQVEIAHNGKQAIDLFESSAVGHFDLLLTDINMPILGGVGVAKYIRALSRADTSLPIIAASTDGVEAFGSKEERSLFTAVLTKPVDINRLVRTVCSCFADDKK